MNTVANPYDALYNNLKNRFTVVHDGKECTVGDYLLMKAGKAPNEDSKLPACVNNSTYDNTAIAIVNYMNERLTVKRAPVKDKTIRRFPIRTSMSAVLSAVAACALVLSCGIFALRGISAIPTAELPEAQVEEVIPEELDRAQQ